MRLSAYLVLMFPIGAIMYLLGFTPIMGPFAEKSGALSITKLTQPSLTTFLNWVSLDPLQFGIILVALTAAIGFVALAGFSSLYLVPIVILGTLAASLFILPTSFFSILPAPFDLLGFGLFNLLQILAVLNFIRGGA